jgi:hypothetical protein
MADLLKGLRGTFVNCEGTVATLREWMAGGAHMPRS